MTARIVSLHIYPVKSCAAIDLQRSPIDRAGLRHDRRWMVVTEHGQFMTQRQWPAMARVRPSISETHLELHAPGMPVMNIALDGSELHGATQSIAVWKDKVPAREESAEAAAWLSELLGVPCKLYKIDTQAERAASSEWVDRWRAANPDAAQGFEGDHCFGFADGFPLLVTNQASLDDLNARLQSRGESPVPMDRFRPNIVIAGDWEAFDEDVTELIVIGDVRLALVKPCTRCPMPNVDQRSGERFLEPGRTLASYRMTDIGVVFGQNAIVDARPGSYLQVGDEVQV
ncbi:MULTISPECIES: MOSC domain-containing protein [unclassified Bordetella]|uniref:MOSC domain-containing protein n=1 Tax=unclassified Bordetella TaxID=2630031 RepID=UPI00132164A5|nr:MULTISPECIES: MOSC N-terminal beta barrel domain-containing protein [unclassified Bordetella]MVW70795.1 MOSC domain-containing protein [Bordetella sp. 15P40C-2]MVW80464.1 MOSC domain-containing protein [Bordetella sp. 02P26C-1]